MIIQITADTYINPEGIEAICFGEGGMIIYHPAAGHLRFFGVSSDLMPTVCRALNIVPPSHLQSNGEEAAG